MWEGDRNFRKKGDLWPRPFFICLFHLVLLMMMMMMFISLCSTQSFLHLMCHFPHEYVKAASGIVKEKIKFLHLSFLSPFFSHIFSFLSLQFGNTDPFYNQLNRKRRTECKKIATKVHPKMEDENERGNGKVCVDFRIGTMTIYKPGIATTYLAESGNRQSNDCLHNVVLPNVGLPNMSVLLLCLQCQLA